MNSTTDTSAAVATRPVRGPLAWLLRLNLPVPERSEAEIEAEVERDYSWNFTVNLLDGGFFWFGASFISATTILPLFVSKLSDNPFWIGLLAVIAQAAWFLPQLFTANWLEKLARQKPVVVNLGLFLERLPVWGIVASAVVAGRSPALALGILFTSYAWHGLGAGWVAASWQDLIARIFPLDRRGRFFGTTMFVGNGAAAAGAALSGWLLVAFPFPTNFAYVFGIAATAILLSWFSLALAREPALTPKGPHRSNRQFMVELPDLLRHDHNFRRFLLSRMLMAMGGMGTGFVTVAAVQRWHIPDSTVGLYTAALMVGQMTGNLTFGFLADRKGHKLCMQLGILASLLGFALALAAPVAELYFLVFTLLGIGSAAVMVSGILIVLEFCEPARRPTYIGIANTGVGLVGIVAPLLGAALAEAGYGWLFAASALVLLLAWALMRWWVRDPRWARATDPGKEITQP